MKKNIYLHDNNLHRDVILMSLLVYAPLLLV